MRIGRRFHRALATALIISGIALLLSFGRFGLVGHYLSVLGITVSFTTAAVVIAEIFVAAHFYVRQAAVGFAQVRRDVEEAAMVDGANRFSVFRRVTVPLPFRPWPSPWPPAR